MTVKDLIAKLSEFDPDALVMSFTYEGQSSWETWDDLNEPYVDKDGHVIFKV